MHFAVLGGDKRQEYLTAYLQQKGHRVSLLSDPWAQADAIVLPLPALDNDGYIRGTRLHPEDVAQQAAGTPVLAGKAESFSHLFPLCEDYAQWESLARDNAHPTAEGAILLALEAMDTTVENSSFLVVGAGRIGTVLAQKLQVLGAQVTVCARREADFARLDSLGLQWDITEKYQKGLHYDCILNTVPSPVFTREQIRKTPRHCVFMELASAPYGVDAEDCKTENRQYILASALPGRFFPKTAGEILARQILAFFHLPT